MKRYCETKRGWIEATGLDIFSDDPVLEFSHADLLETDECNGTFRRRVISTGEDKQEVFWCCDECLLLMTREELITLAAETYGHDWERFCVFQKEDDDYDDHLGVLEAPSVYAEERLDYLN